MPFSRSFATLNSWNMLVVQKKASVASTSSQGQRDPLGREKTRLVEEQNTKVTWQHGMDNIKDAGTAVIGASQETSAAQDKSIKASSRL